MIAGLTAEQHGDSKIAEARYEEALNRYPTFTPAIKRLAIVLAEIPGNDNRAYGLAMKARAALPDDRDLAKTLGILSYRRGDYSSAVRYLEAVTQQRDRDAREWYYLGMARVHLKDNAAGRDALEHALKLQLRPDLAADAKQILDQIE